MIKPLGSKQKSFEDQWSHPEKIKLSGGEVEAYDISPKHQKTSVPTVFVPGWSGTPEAYKDNIKIIVENGRRTISVNAPHGIDHNKENISPAEVSKIPDAELRKIAAFIGTLKEKGIEKVDAVGHSQGCMDIVLTAVLYPEHFRNIVLVDPAGMIGKDNFWRLATSFTADLVRGYIDEVRNKGLSESLLRRIRGVAGSITGSPVLAFREALAISDAQIQDFLASLRKKGIGISVISAVDDETFPVERMVKIINEDMVDGFYSIKGKHFQFQTEAGSYAGLVEGALSAMEEKTKNRK